MSVCLRVWPSFSADVSPLDAGWEFKKGDDAGWALAVPSVTDKNIRVGIKWEDAGYPDYDGYGWYFKTFDLSESARSGDLVLSLGKIDDADEAFLNGVRIGQMGRMPPNFQSQWMAARNYFLPASLLKNRNTLAVRVFDNGGGGGLYDGTPRLMTSQDYERMMMDKFKPHRSFNEIPFSNGLTSSKLNLNKNCVDSFREHIYSQPNEKTQTRDFGVELFAAVGPQAPKIQSAAYLNGSGIVKYSVILSGRPVDCFVFAPFTEQKRKLYFIVRMGKNFPAPLTFKTGFRLSNRDQRRTVGSSSILSSADGKDFISIQPLADGGSLPALRSAGALLTIDRVNPQSEWMGLAITYSTGQPDTAPEDRSPEKILQTEIDWWEAWHAVEKFPEFKSDAERELFRQSTAILKMGQCREPEKSYGQILASLPPGHWNICWIRDASYAINGLIESNHLPEAHDALTFFLKASAGKYKNFPVDGKDLGVGVPYQISVCRYFGDGSEESDGGHDPNIELDGFGLFLWVLEKYFNATLDHHLLNIYHDGIFAGTADALLHVIEDGTNIVRPESGPWERHLIDNGYNGVKRFAYTSATAYQGLLSASRLAKARKIKGADTKYEKAAERLKKGFNAQFVAQPGGYLKGLAEESDIEKCLDAGAVEGINFGLVDKTVAAKTLETFDRYLKKPNTPGYARNDDGGDYDIAEWVVIDLRVASAFARLGNRDRYEKLIDWVTSQSSLNFNIIAELYDVESASYSGAVPMCGFGPGAYITALSDRSLLK